MRKFFNRRNVFVTLAAIVFLPIGWWASSGPRGRVMAHFDLASGHYRVLAYGLPPAGVLQYAKILRGRYGVEYRQVALCTVGPSTMAYVDSYDKVSEAAIQQKFGHDIFKSSWGEATKTWKEKHKADLQNVSRSE